MPSGVGSGTWLLAGAITAAALLLAHVTLLRFDLSMVPIALGTMAAVGALAQGAQRAYPGALTGSIAAVVLAALVGWWWFAALRRARARVASTATSFPEETIAAPVPIRGT